MYCTGTSIYQVKVHSFDGCYDSSPHLKILCDGCKIVTGVESWCKVCPSHFNVYCYTLLDGKKLV